MDFTLTDEQELLRDTARALATKECPPALVRAHADDPSVADALWRAHLRDWVALGSGSLVDLALFAEELGRVLAPGVFVPTAALFAPLVDEVGAPWADVASAVGAGNRSGTVALAGGDGVWDAGRLVDGPLRTWVLEADRVDTVAIVAADGPDSARIALVDASALEPRLVETLDTTRRAFEVAVPDDAFSGGHPVAEVSRAAVQRVIERATVVVAAELVGVARWLLDTSVAYAGERVQFDRPIGAFQGLQFKLVDMALDVERATAAVYAAAMASDAEVPERHRLVHVAKAAAGRAARHAARDGLQVHGGIGYTWEHDLHLYLRRAYAGDYLLGSATWHHDRLAGLLLG